MQRYDDSQLINEILKEADSLSNKFKQGIETYSGQKVKKIEIVEDPKVSGTYAIRTLFEKDKPTEWSEWLLVHFDKKWTKEIISQNLEETEFTKWPPTSGNLKFF
jgi:hypothetical protein